MNIYLGELEETAAELEMCRRKLATLRSQKEAAAVAPPNLAAGHLGVKAEGGDRVSGSEKVSREARELEAALEETKVQLVLLLNFQSRCVGFSFLRSLYGVCKCLLKSLMFLMGHLYSKKVLC